MHGNGRLPGLQHVVVKFLDCWPDWVYLLQSCQSLQRLESPGGYRKYFFIVAFFFSSATCSLFVLLTCSENQIPHLESDKICIFPLKYVLCWVSISNTLPVEYAWFGPDRRKLRKTHFGSYDDSSQAHRLLFPGQCRGVKSTTLG